MHQINDYTTLTQIHQKICNMIFWIENFPLILQFSENSSNLVCTGSKKEWVATLVDQQTPTEWKSQNVWRTDGPNYLLAGVWREYSTCWYTRPKFHLFPYLLVFNVSTFTWLLFQAGIGGKGRWTSVPSRHFNFSNQAQLLMSFAPVHHQCRMM